MKKITRMIFFSTVSLYSTPFIIGGFQVKGGLVSFLTASLILAFFYYIIIPLTKIVLLPLNILTMGFVSIIVYLFLFNYVINSLNLVTIEPWIFGGVTVYGVGIPEIDFNYLETLVASAITYSTLINLLDALV